MTRDKIAFKQFFTPKKIADLLVKNISKKSVKTAIDLAVGNGELLLAVISKYKKCDIYGADIDSKIISEVMKNTKLKEINLWIGDSLSFEINNWREYKSIINNGGFDLIIGNPPFDYFDKINFNDKNYVIEVAFLIKAIQIANTDGIIAFILPNGFFSNRCFKTEREYILKHTRIKMVIQLYRNSFKDVNTDISMIILQKKKIYRIQKRILLKKLDEDLNEREIYISANEGIERLDFDYYYNIDLVIQRLYNTGFQLDFLENLIIDCKRGISITKEKKCISSNGRLFIHTTNVDNIFINKKKCIYIDNKYYSKFQRAKVSFGDVLVGRVGSNCINKVGIITKEEDVGSIISDCLFDIKCKGINPYYLAVFLKSKLGIGQLQSIKRGSCSKYITKEDLLKILVPIIEVDTQNKIEERVRWYINNINDSKKLDKCIKDEVKKLNIIFNV